MAFWILWKKLHWPDECKNKIQAGKNARVCYSPSDICSDGSSWSKSGFSECGEHTRLLSVGQQKWVCCFPQMLRGVLLAGCSTCILGRGELELVARCAFRRDGEQADDERRLCFHILLSSAVENALHLVSRCGNLQLLHPALLALPVLMSSRRHCAVWGAVPLLLLLGARFHTPAMKQSNAALGLCDSSEQFLGLAEWCNQWLVYSVSVNSSVVLLFFFPLYVWKCLWFPPPPPS